MANATLNQFSAQNMASLAGSVLRERDAERQDVVTDMLRSGAKVKLDDIVGASEIRYKEEFSAIDYTDVVASSTAYVEGTAAKRAICIADDHSDAIGKEHQTDLIVVTHLALIYQTADTDIVAGLRIAANDLAVGIKAPGIDRPEVLQPECLAHWLAPDAHVEGQDFDAGQQLITLEKRGEWVDGLRKLPRPLVIVQGKRAELEFSLPSTQVPGSNCALPLKLAFRYHKLVGVSGK